MTKNYFAVPIEARFFEDYSAGAIHEFGSTEVSEAEIIEFANKYDPQFIHTDPEAAREGMYGGLIASGWLTGSLMMRMYADHYLSKVASLGSPGVDELRWIKPVRPGDVLSVRVTIEETKQSQSKPDRGIVRSFIEVINQKDETVMSMRAVNFLLCRNAQQI
ncbi:MAG: acyl dehydratase [Proteobacteria bacterium]|nr:MAG: acyl dehydratase [Pseudomonadota bacterium]QKK12460.1 MAG: MaoC family dehydratase [Pseudomonadota bacterium]